MTISQTGATAVLVDQNGISGKAYVVGYDHDGDDATADLGSWTVGGGDLEDLTIADLSSSRPQSLVIGLGPNAPGLVTITDMGTTLRMTNDGKDDTASGLVIGRDGGEGRLELTGMTAFEILDSSTAVVGAEHGFDDREFLRVGNGVGSSGDIQATTATLTIEGNAVAIDIGSDGGAGTVTFIGGSQFRAIAHDTASSAQLSFAMGTSGGNGTMTFSNYALGVLQADDVRLIVGQDAGKGLLVLDSSSRVTVQGGAAGANATIGSGAGAIASLSIANASEFTLQGSGVAGLDVGRAGSTGTFELSSQSLLKIAGAANSYLVMGRDVGSQGSGSIENSTLWVEAGGTGNASADIGSAEGHGTLRLAANGILHLQSAAGTSLSLGSDDGSGVLTLDRTAAVEMSGNRVSAAIGVSGGIGEVAMNGGAWTLASTTSASLNIGHAGTANGADSGFGTMTVQNGAHVDFNVETKSDLAIGGGEGSTAMLVVRGGGVIDMNAGNDPNVVAAMKIGTRGAASATVILDGATSKILHLDYVGVGYSPDDSFGVAGGHGTLLVRNGASLGVDSALVIGAGGMLGGLNGTVVGNVKLAGGARVDLRDGKIGVFTVNGDLFVNRAANSLTIDVASGGANDRLVLHKFGTTAGGELGINLNMLGGFKFAAGETRTVISMTGVDAGSNRPSWSVGGQHVDFAYYGGRLDSDAGKFFFKALNSGATGGIGVLDFGAAKPAGALIYDATANHGVVTGGQFTAAGGRVYNADQFLGTNLGDTLTITGAAPRSFTLDGRGGADALTGGMGLDRLVGGSGDDTLNGGGGADLMQGGADSDRYIVDNAGDVVDEFLAGSNGLDLVQSTISFNLADTVHVKGAVENLTLLNVSTASNGTGNALGNTITGNNFNNVLNGGLGNDTLNGGLGNDTFVFNTALNASTNRDTIDFRNSSGNNDSFQLDNAIFTKLGANGALNAAFFKVGAAAVDANDYIVYNQSTGALYYDSNGNAVGGMIQFATLINKPVLTAVDFVVV